LSTRRDWRSNIRQDVKSLISYLSTQIKKLGVTIELGKEATPELVQGMKPEILIVATGGTPIIPEIPGIEKDKVVTAIDLLLGNREAGESVVVMGGGLVGCETAAYLAQKGKQLTIVEILDSVARDMSPPNRMLLLRMLDDARVKVLTDTSVLEITDEGIVVADRYGARSTLKADTVVLSIGLKSEKGLWQTLNNSSTLQRSLHSSPALL